MRLQIKSLAFNSLESFLLNSEYLTLKCIMQPALVPLYLYEECL